eukprot:15365920-Ditylum_brightwellii.AAC.2
MTNDAGTEIKPWALTGEMRAHPTIEWPNQEKPADTCFITWNRFLKKHFCTDAKCTQCLNKPLRLSTPLGSWITNIPYSMRSFYYCLTSHSIIHYVDGSFSEYTRAPGRSTLYRLRGPIDSLPDAAVRILASKLGPFLSSTAAADYVINHPSLSDTCPSAFTDYMQQLPKHVKCFLGNLHCQQIDVDYRIAALQQGHVHISTDGSVADRKGYHAVVFHTDSQMLQFQGPCDGLPLLMTSYRSELSGILVTLYFISALQDFTKESILAHLPLYCDNSAAVLSSNTTTAPGVTSHLCPDYNVVSEVWSQLKQVPHMNVAWVKTHQDDAKPICKLSIDAKLNCTANRDAKLFRLNAPDNFSPVGVPPVLPLNHAYDQWHCDH